MTKGTSVPQTERITLSFQQLAAASGDLNSTANELNETIETLNDALHSLNLGVSAWHQVAGNEDPQDGSFWSRAIGYARVRNKWGIALRKTAGDLFDPEDYNEEVWLFSDAPRWMCIESVGKLPDLIDDLIKRTQDATEKLKAKTIEAKELATVITAAASELRQKAGKKK